MVQAFSMGTAKRGINNNLKYIKLGQENKNDTPGPGTYNYDKK